MDESDALMDLVLVDTIAMLAVVAIYVIQAKVRSLFHGFKGLRTEHYLRSRLGMPAVADMVRRRSSRPLRKGDARSPLAFWLRYWTRKGLPKAVHRFTLERRLRKMLHAMTKTELDDIAYSLMFWRRRDCPNEELYIARPPHHITLEDNQPFAEIGSRDERRQRMLALKSKSSKEVISWIRGDIRRHSSISLQWLYDSLNKGWVGDVGATRSKAIRLTEENEARSASVLHRSQSTGSGTYQSWENRL
jgi:hypothetical protein